MEVRKAILWSYIGPVLLYGSSEGWMPEDNFYETPLLGASHTLSDSCYSINIFRLDVHLHIEIYWVPRATAAGKKELHHTNMQSHWRNSHRRGETEFLRRDDDGET